MSLQYKTFENSAGKGEIAPLRAISPFPTVFSTGFENFLQFSSNLKLSSANSFILEESKICRLGKGLHDDDTNPRSHCKSRLFINATHKSLSLSPIMPKAQPFPK